MKKVAHFRRQDKKKTHAVVPYISPFRPYSKH